MYIATKEDLKSGSLVDVQFSLPGFDETLIFKGKIAHRTSPLEAAKSGFVPGVGLQFVDLSEPNRLKLHQFIRRLDIHRRTSQRRIVSKIPQEGTLDQFIVPEILMDLLKRKANGCLVLTRQDVVKKVYFRRGFPIYVDSNVRTELLGHFLIQRGLIREEDYEASLEDLKTSDLKHGEIMVARGMIGSDALADSLSLHQEEKLSNTFYWFDGTYQFVELESWPKDIFIFPLRTFHIILEGITKWYSPALIEAWMGLEDTSLFFRVGLPKSELNLPPGLNRLIGRLRDPKSMAQLQDELNLSKNEIMPLLFCSIICGFVNLVEDLEAETIDEDMLLQNSKKPDVNTYMQDVTLNQTLKRIEALERADFYTLLDVKNNVDPSTLLTKFNERLEKLDALEENTNHEILLQKISKVKFNLRLAYDTLCDKGLKSIYDKKHNSQTRTSTVDKEVDLERIILSAFREIKNNEFENAQNILIHALEAHPQEASLQGYLGWVLYVSSPDLNAKEAQSLIDQALMTHATDARLWFFMGKIAFDLKEMWKAKKCLEKALQINPKLQKAAELLAKC